MSKNWLREFIRTLVNSNRERANTQRASTLTEGEYVKLIVQDHISSTDAIDASIWAAISLPVGEEIKKVEQEVWRKIE